MMNISKHVVVCLRQTAIMCAAIGMGATLTANSQQVVVAPSQSSGGTFTIRRPIEVKILKGQPYAAEIVNESVQTLGDGNKIVQRSTGRVYRDVEGRVRREDDRTSGTPAVTISDPVANLSWTLNPADKTARELPGLNLAGLIATVPERLRTVNTSVPTVAAGGVGRSAGGGAGVNAAGGQIVARSGGGGGRGGRVGSPNERTEEALPNKSIENLLCTGVRRTTTIATGAIGNEQPIKIVSEEWTSIDLQVLVLTDLNDPRTGRSTYKLSNVRRADPDLTLFKVPADYTITRGGGRGGGGN